MKTERVIQLSGQDEAVRFCGAYDRYLREVSHSCGVKVYLKGNLLKIKGERRDVEKAYEALQKIAEKLRSSSDELSPDTVSDIISGKPPARTGYSPVPQTQSEMVKPRTDGQRHYIELMETNDIVVCIGPAGTGKTYLAVARALHCLRSDVINKIILARPAVEAGERLGFLPGDYQEKVNPYLRPLYDALNSFLPFQQTKRLIDNEIIEVVPLAYMRGRNLDHAFMILDEGQNTTSEQMKMFLTRMGERSKIVVTGDITQIDLPVGKVSGLVEAQSVLGNVQGIAFSYLTRADIVRHPLVQSIVDAYEKKRQMGKKNH
jgi:phosphate starvation-inducible PhoH-like protein